MQEHLKKVVAGIVNDRRPATVLDAPCGKGWLLERVSYDVRADGVDLYEPQGPKYVNFHKHDLDNGLPDGQPTYDCVVCCEGIEHIGNPALYLTSAWKRLAPGGFIIITTPNVWYPASRLKYLLRGFFPGFPSLAGKIIRGTHMHIMPWSFPMLYLFLKLYGFKDITLHATDAGPKHQIEKLLALPHAFYLKGKLKRCTGEEARYWKSAASSLYGRGLVVTAEKDPEFDTAGTL